MVESTPTPQGKSNPLRTVLLAILVGLVAIVGAAGIYCYFLFRGFNREVTDDPYYVGSYRRGQVVVTKTILLYDDHGDKIWITTGRVPQFHTGPLAAGTRLRVGRAYHRGGTNVSSVYLEAEILNGSLKGRTAILSLLSKHVGYPRRITGPDPEHLSQE